MTADVPEGAGSLLERDAQLDALAGAWKDACAGRGGVALVTGEAGVGKTMLVERFAARAARDGEVVAGACDALFTPRPLGPVIDVLAQLRARSLAAAVGGDRQALFAPLLADVSQRERPLALVLEDVHWADEATLDVVKFLGRRVGRLPLLLVLTYRDDEVGAAHPLRAVLGDFPRAATRRVAVPPLTRAAVAALAEDRGDPAPADLYEITGGNPFFVTEVLAGGGERVPATVRDAVLVRALRLSPPAREALQLASLSPAPVESWLALACLPASDTAFDECVAGGMLRIVDDRYAFRHELARLAVRGTLAPQRRHALSRRLLDALAARGDEALDARMAHHAEECEDADALLQHATDAGRRAARLGSHVEAIRHLERAAAHADRLPPDERSRLLGELAQECHVASRIDRSIAWRERAIAIAREAGDVQLQATHLCMLVSPLVAAGRNGDAEQACAQALALLEPHGASAGLAHACRAFAHVRMLARDCGEAVTWAKRAIAIAEATGAEQTRIAALNALGSALILDGDEDGGRAALEACLQRAEARGLDLDVLNALANLGSGFGEVYRFEAAERYLLRGIATGERFDADHSVGYQSAWLALCRLHQGRWDDAGAIAGRVVARADYAAITRIMALVALGRLRARRGDPGAWDALDEGLVLAERTATLQRVAPVRAARAEAAWLDGDRGRAMQEAAAAYPLALAKSHAWFVGELAYWQRQGGALDRMPDEAAEPFRLQMLGQPREAAAAWRRRGCPYEAARALAESSDEDDMKAALRDLVDLGARPAADALRQRLVARGVRTIPRGPRASTKRNPFGLTARELEVLALLAGGLTNGAIAARLHRSEKTVDHHVSAVLAKLDVGSREAAAAVAASSGLLEK